MPPKLSWSMGDYRNHTWNHLITLRPQFASFFLANTLQTDVRVGKLRRNRWSLQKSCGFHRFFRATYLQVIKYPSDASTVWKVMISSTSQRLWYFRLPWDTISFWIILPCEVAMWHIGWPSLGVSARLTWFTQVSMAAMTIEWSDIRLLARMSNIRTC